MSGKVYELAVSLRPFETEGEIKKLLSEGVPPDEMLDSLRKAMIEACEKYDKGEFSLPQLSAMIAVFHMGYEVLKDRVESPSKKGKILIGTLGSVHYIGKDIIKFMYVADGFDVHDLGENLLADSFIGGISELNPDLVAISIFLTNAMPELGKVVDYLEKNNLRKRTKIIIGGAQGNPRIAAKYKLDGWGHDPKTALKLANELVVAGGDRND